jgi:hypothetical protein
MKEKTNRIMAGRGLHIMAQKLVIAAYGRGYRAARLHYKKIAEKEIKAAYKRGRKAAR